MTPAPEPAADAACRRLLDQALAGHATPSAADAQALATLPPAQLEGTLWTFARDHGAAALPLLSALAEHTIRALRRPARRVLYRLAQRGVTAPAAPPARPLVARGGERPVRAWLSGVDGSGSRAAWILFEDTVGALRLCSLILNDEMGILDAAGGAITRKRLERELSDLAASRKLPWVESAPERTAGLVTEALARHRDAGTAPPAAFERWRPLFDDVQPAGPPPLSAAADPALIERSAELLELPELTGWFFEPERVHADALALLQARESRLVVSDQVKAERQEALITGVVEREMTPEARSRWARRLAEMALVFDAAGAGQHARLAGAAAAALADEHRDVRHHPFVRGLAARSLEIAAEIALGRISASDATRRPRTDR